MKESALFRKVIGEKLLNQDSIQERAIATAQAALLQSDGKATSGVRDAGFQNKRPRTGRLILAINLTLMAVVVGLVVIIAADLIHPAWIPVWLGGYTTTSAPTETVTTTKMTTTTPTTEMTTEPTEWSVQGELNKVEPKSTLGDLRLYQDLISWEKYTDAKVHQTEVVQTWNNEALFYIEMIDEKSNLYISNYRNEKYPDSISTIGTYSLTDGTYQLFAKAATDKHIVSFMAQNTKYIVWQEGLHSQMGEIVDPIIHVFVRETGEDITFTLPGTGSSYYSNRSIGPASPALLLNDSVYFSVPSRTVNTTQTLEIYQDLYQFNIATQERKIVNTNASSPFLYNGEPAWFSLDYERNVATAMSSSGLISGVPSIPALPVLYGNVINVAIANDRILLQDQGNDRGLLMLDGGVSIPIIARNSVDTYIDNPQINGDYAAFASETAETPRMFFDANRSVLVDITDEIGKARFIGFFDNKMFFMYRPVYSPDYMNVSTFITTVYWIDLDEVG